MDNKRRARDLDMSPNRLWPTLQRRKLEKLKDVRMREFERACDDSLEWLENYYQGCVYAALQNKPRTETNQTRHSPFSRSVEYDSVQQPSHDRHDQLQQQATPPRMSSRVIARNGITLEQQYNHASPSEWDIHGRDEYQEARMAAAADGLFSSSMQGTPMLDSPSLLSRSHDQHHFHLKSPRTPKLLSPKRSPRSPYERHRITPKRTRLRVDASAATRKAQRALRTSQHRRERVSGGFNLDSQSGRMTMEGLISKESTTPPAQRGPSQSIEAQRRTISYRSTTPLLPPLSALSLSSKIATVQVPAPLPKKALSFEAADTAETGNLYKTPSRGPNIHDQTFIKSGKDVESRSMKSDEDEEAKYSHLTPGSRARDSMTLVSPRNRSGSMKERNVYLPSTPALTQGLSGISDSSGGKRSSQDMDIDLDVQIYDAEYKRPRSSPFQDSVAPVRFDSPERDSVRLDAKSSRLGVPGRNSGSQGGGRASSNSVSTDATLADDVIRRRERSGTSSSIKSQDQWFTGRPSEVQGGSRKRPISIASSRHSRSELSEERDTDIRRSVLEVDVHEDRPPSKLSGASSRTPLEVAKAQASVLSLTSAVDDSDRKTDNQVVPQQRDRAERAAPEPAASHTSGASQLLQQPRTSQVADSSSTSKVESAGEAQGSTSSSSAKDSQSGSSSTDRVGTKAPTIAAAASTALGHESNSVSRSRVATTLPEKRTLGLRKPYTLMSSSQPQPPTSRLTKMTSALPPTMVSAHTIVTMPSNQSQISSANPSTRITKAGGPSAPSRDTQQSSQAGGVTKTMSTVSYSVPTIFRQGVPRAPLPSVVMKATESSLARAESTQNALARKPFLNAKSLFSLKKPTRPVLPDSTLTAKSIALSGIMRAGTISPKKDSKRDMKHQQQIQQQSREPTPDIYSRTNASSTQSGSTMLTALKTAGGSISTVQQNSSSSTTTVASAAISSSALQIRGSSSSILATASNGIKHSANPFLVPAPVRPPILPAWAQNQNQNQSQNEKTFLPQIVSDPEDEGEQESGHGISSSKRRSNVPDWAQWEELEKSMQRQSNMNPEEIFGPLPVLDMGEIFPGRKKKHRPRTSSAHWGASDRLTAQEVVRYNEDMGWLSKE